MPAGPPLAAPANALVGRVLGGRYRLIAPLGMGASAHVFLAEDTVLGRRVAARAWSILTGEQPPTKGAMAEKETRKDRERETTAAR